MASPVENECALSVVIASVESAAAVASCVESIRAATGGLGAEILVVDASRDGSAMIAASLLGESNVLRLPPGALVPELWARGIMASTGRAVALTIAQCRVPPSWARALLGGLKEHGLGVAGALELDSKATALDRAVFYLRYSDFLRYRGSTAAAETIPADNALYDGESVRQYVQSFSGGFWEVDFHRRALSPGRRLGFVPGGEATYSSSPGLSTLIAHRFRHGRHSGSWRATVGARPRWKIMAAAPLVPLLLTARVASRVRRDPEHRRGFVSALVPFLVLATAWALGEAWGAARTAVSPSPAGA